MQNKIKMNIKQRINAFSKLGDAIKQKSEILKQGKQNPWFTPDNLDYAFAEISKSLSKANLEKWVLMYHNLKKVKEPKCIGVITAGNIPLVGFHDFLSVLISGHKFIGKLSSKNDKLLPKLIKMLIEIEPEFKDYISITENRLTGFDAVIATGSNNSARYFDYYFGRYPHIIRKNRSSIAVLTGNETNEELDLLADDIFLYFGLGCRSVSKLFLPESYNLDNIFKKSLKYKEIINHNKYANNYDYNRAIYLMNITEFKDNGIMLMKEDTNISSPISVVYFEYYSDIKTVKQKIDIEQDSIQCVIANDTVIKDATPFGESQKPQLWDYADNIDTLEFLIAL